MEDQIVISNVEIVNKHALYATCDVYIKPWDLTLFEVCVFQKGNQRWVGMPSKKMEKDGEVSYKALMGFKSDARMKKFRDGVMKAVDAHLLANPNADKFDFGNGIPF